MLLRRSISSLLCWLLLMPSLFALGVQKSSLPECCRRGGVHHCEMAMTPDAAMQEAGDFATASNPCPYQHTAVKLRVSASALLLLPRHLELAVSVAPMVWHKAQVFDSAALDRASRGPPAV